MEDQPVTGGATFSYPGTQVTPDYVQDGVYGWQWQITPPIDPATDIDQIVSSVFAPHPTAPHPTMLGDLGVMNRPKKPRLPMVRKPNPWAGHKPMRPVGARHPHQSTPMPGVMAGLSGKSVAEKETHRSLKAQRQALRHQENMSARSHMAGIFDIFGSDESISSAYPYAESMTTTDWANVVVSGNLGSVLKSQRTLNQTRTGDLQNYYLSIMQMPEGSDRDTAMSLYQQGNSANVDMANKTFELINMYNSLVNQLQTYTLGAVKISPLGDLGIIGVDDAVIFWVASTLAAMGMAALLVAAFRVDFNFTGILSSLSDVIKSGGGTIKDVGSTFVDVAETSGKWALIGAIAFAAYYLVKNSSKAKSALGL